MELVRHREGAQSSLIAASTRRLPQFARLVLGQNAMVCSSVNLVRFIVRPQVEADSN